MDWKYVYEECVLGEMMDKGCSREEAEKIVNVYFDFKGCR